ncbi:hypothetical protein H696_04868 [Fonticula alba]|uniref:Proteasome endopeptidase complex n=1 Tax=Fonticula alba TaxID=691883 RepID=A0A058Z2S2_FONAL|nr:hypothetical protein H696_04868 [Fonticula alba]KCV68574.1 hypothetical protein H696_04868 [Fonticula alba]|eukprot:XP_009497006.1 hypothetical protein H696_04868 [Fonticula alba]
MYGSRPYGVGMLIAGHDETGPHLLEFSPAGVSTEVLGGAIGARSQAARTYLERHCDTMKTATLDELVLHALLALRDTLPQDAPSLVAANISIAVVGPDAAKLAGSAATGTGSSSTASSAPEDLEQTSEGVGADAGSAAAVAEAARRSSVDHSAPIAVQTDSATEATNATAAAPGALAADADGRGDTFIVLGSAAVAALVARAEAN